MGAVIVNTGSKTHQRLNNVWPFSEKPTRFFAPFCDHRQDIDPLLYPRDKTATEAMETC